MNIIILLGGQGIRFKNDGYLEPKPLIKIFEKQMIFYVLDNLKLLPNDKLFIIYYNLDDYDFEKIINNKYSNINFIKLDKQTSGASETIYLGLKHIKNITNNKKCLLLDCDTFYTQDIIKKYRNVTSNAVFYTINNEKTPLYSYIQIDDSDKIIKIIEKVKISDYANTGIYCFEDINELYNYSKFIVENNIHFNNECYISCIIDKMISDNKYFKAIKLKNEFVFNLGTPLQLNNFINKTFIFLFDLDGTLIITDDIYYDVWKSILSNYNIDMNYEIFTNYIQGKSDLTVLKNLIPNKYNELINTISNLKDDLFLQNINKIKIIDGVIDFILKIKKIGYKIGIVTNCNKKVALEILNKLEINNIIDKLVCGDDSEKPKPYPDPYIKAIKYFNSTNEKTIIFEDSKTGIQSAKNTFPKCLIGIETIYNSEELLICGVDLTIKNYINLEINNILQYKNINVNKITEYVKASMIGTKIEKIEIDNNKLKGGFISDVIGLKIYTEYEILDSILKLENTNETFLSKMAHDLGLYEREYYFYETILKYIPIKTPKFYGEIRNNDFNKIGILMNNLVNLNYKLNLDLNKEKIDVSLKIIERLAQLHATFFDKDLKKIFNELKKHTDPLFNPSWQNFIQSKWINFKSKWCKILSKEQIEKTEWIVNNFSDIQQSLSDKNLTLCHGDVKSANIFYQQIDNGYEPYFIDWQYICEGKGVQDLVFFMIESFEIETINQYKNIFKDYYYVKLKEYGVINYSREDYEKDFQNSIYYFPIFVAFWFGTLNEDELIDKNFPFFFIQRLYNFIE